MEVAGCQPKSTAVHRGPNKLWRSNSIFNLWAWLWQPSWPPLKAPGTEAAHFSPQPLYSSSCRNRTKISLLALFNTASSSDCVCVRAGGGGDGIKVRSVVIP